MLFYDIVVLIQFWFGSYSLTLDAEAAYRLKKYRCLPEKKDKIY